MRRAHTGGRSRLARSFGDLVIVLTVGHSTQPLEEFVELLCVHQVTHLVDVRTIPKSRHNPQFNRETLPGALRATGIGYSHMPGLGGLRRASKGSLNTGWRTGGFRGYADYMQTPEFENNLAALVRLAERELVSVMCAEAVPWRCHRQLIADALVVRGVPVEHILSPTRRDPHALTPFARVAKGRITYPREPDPADDLFREGAA